jgi:RNA-directed DNA polymerase
MAWIQIETLSGMKISPLPAGLSLQENLENRYYGEKQMTVVATLTGASSSANSWDTINWQSCESHVHRLQMRIAKAIQEKRYGKVKSLQWLLTHSKAAKFLAVKRVVDNRGSKTAGIDKELWLSNSAKLDAVNKLQRRGYKAEPLRRIYIPKKNGKQRPLGIPTLKDRAMQALHLLALEPIAEVTADRMLMDFDQSVQQLMQLSSALNRLRGNTHLNGFLKGIFAPALTQLAMNGSELIHQWTRKC